ncbi:hypothetical protein D4R52_01165 [bacterium]|nr:MAG: hypothetical protein D4R52_01165 [bacterium]
MKTKSIIYLLSLSLFFSLPLAASADSAHKDGEIINDNGTIYLIKNQQCFAFRTAEEFFSNGYQFEMAVPANTADLTLPSAGIIKARDGSLVRDSRDTSAYYFAFATGLRKIGTDTLYLLGLEKQNYFEIDLSDYSIATAYSLSSAFESPQPGTLINDSGKIYLIAQNGRAPFSTPAIFYSYGYDFSAARLAGPEDLKLQELAPLPYRDGALVNDRGTIYLISNGTKFGFQTWNGFTSRGYEIKTAVSGDTSGYAQGINFD